MIYTPATPADIDFITDAVFAAVKSGTGVLSYSTLFEISEDRLRPLFKDMLAEDVEGQELWLTGFLIAKDENRNPAATCCAWVEGEEGPSSVLTAQLLSYYLGKEAMAKAVEKAPIIESLRVDREEGALQIEHVYTAPGCRGQGLAAEVIRQQVKNRTALQPGLKKVQVILFKANSSALRAYTKMGFEAVSETHSAHPQATNYFPAATRVLMEAGVKHFGKSFL